MVYIYDSEGSEVLRIDVEDKSYRYRKLMGEDSVILYFATPTYVDIPIGSFIDFQGARYTLLKPTDLKMIHTRNYEYTVTFESAQAALGKYFFRDTIENLSFSLTAKPTTHLELLITNLNSRPIDTGWSAGSVIDADEKTVNYDYMTCEEALKAMASEFDTEFEIVGKTISLHKVEYNKSAPLALEYGKGKGFRSGIGRTTDSVPVEVLALQTSDRNIDYTKYGSKNLLLPSEGSTLIYNDREYVVNNDRRSIQRNDTTLGSYAEACLDATEIYPTYEHTITSVDDDNPCKFCDSGTPESLDYGQCRIAGEVMTIIFQSGELAGREFDIVQTDKALSGYVHEQREFTIVQDEEVPSETLKPSVGDKFKVFHCAMPDVYICDDDLKKGASWTLFQKAAKYLYDNEDQKFTYTGELDPIFAKTDWTNIGGKIVLGGYVRFKDSRWQPTPVDIRIVGIKDYINNPHAPVLDLSNDEVSSGVASLIKQMEADEKNEVRDTAQSSLSFTRRRFIDAKKTIEMLEKAFEGYSPKLKPISVETLLALVGDESLQFEFLKRDYATVTEPHMNFDTTSKKFTVGSQTQDRLILHHFTLKNKTISTAVTGRCYWSILNYQSAVLDDAAKSYYLYAKCSDNLAIDNDGDYTANGEFILSDDAIALHTGNYYYFLVGCLMEEQEDGTRSYNSVYGYTEISGGRIVTDLIRSADGLSYFNLALGSFMLSNSSNSSYLKWNVNGDGRLRIRGALNVTGTNDEIETPIVTPRGDYSDSTYYQYGDMVIHNGSSYYAIYSDGAFSGKTPPNSTYWRVFAARGEQGDSLSVQWSVDGTDWHGSYSVGDLYMREKLGDGSWSDAIRVVGEDGVDGSYISFVFKGMKSSDGAPDAPTSTDPVPEDEGWSDNPPVQEYKFVRPSVATGGWYEEDGLIHSNTITHSESTWSKLVFNANSGDKVAFKLTAYSESNYDFAYLLDLDSEDKTNKKLKLSGNGTSGTYVSNTIQTTGEHFIMVGYEKDSSQSKYQDCATLEALGFDAVWMTRAKVTNGVAGEWSTPICISGTAGYNGRNGYDGYGISESIVSYNSDSQGITPPENGWTSDIPNVPAGFYLWTRTHIIYEDPDKDPVDVYSVSRIAADGQDGSNGKNAPVSPYQGVYSGSKIYYGNDVRTDIVLYDGSYYIAKSNGSTDRQFVGRTPSSSSAYWMSFGANFDNIATGFLFAELAYVDKLGVRNVKVNDSNGNVVAGLMPANSDGNGDYILWAGGASGDNASFSVKSDGTVKAKGAISAVSDAYTDGTNSYYLHSGKGLKVDSGRVDMTAGDGVLINAGSNSLNLMGGSLMLSSFILNVGTSNLYMPAGGQGAVYVVSNNSSSARTIYPKSGSGDTFAYSGTGSAASYSLAAYKTVIAVYHNNKWRIIG